MWPNCTPLYSISHSSLQSPIVSLGLLLWALGPPMLCWLMRHPALCDCTLTSKVKVRKRKSKDCFPGCGDGLPVPAYGAIVARLPSRQSRLGAWHASEPPPRRCPLHSTLSLTPQPDDRHAPERRGRERRRRKKRGGEKRGGKRREERRASGHREQGGLGGEASQQDASVGSETSPLKPMCPMHNW